MLPHLAEVSIRSLLLALPAAIVLWILRSRRTAALQHAVWAAVVCGMLALFALGQALPRLSLRILDRPAASLPAAPPAVPANAAVIDEPPEAAQLPSPVPRRAIDWPAVAVYAYGAIALAFLAHFVTGMLLVRRLLAKSGSVRNFLETEAIAVPVTAGWLRPRIVLPLEWREWDREKLDAVLAHEGAHIRRRDGLVAALAGVNRCVFWFHPLAWVLERKLALLAEQACDESCVAALGDRERYANLLLEMALVVDGAHGRLRRHALTMAAGSHIRQRIDALLQEGRTFSRGLSWTAWAAVALCGIPVLWGAGAVELDRQPPVLPLAMPRWVAPAPSVPEQTLPERRPVVLAQAQAAPAPPAAPQAAPAVTAKFDVASVRPCAPGDGAGRKGRGGAGGRGSSVSPGRLYVNCMSVFELINSSVELGNDEPLLNDSTGPFDAQRVRGGPEWVSSERYTIDAQTADPVANGPAPGRTPASRLMRGAMLRALLEDRFQLRTHREVEEAPMYALIVAPGGFKLHPMEEGSCTPYDPSSGLRMSEVSAQSQKPLCIGHVGWEGQNWTLDAAGESLSSFAGAFSGIMGRHVFDKTGIAGLYNFHLVFGHDQNTPGDFPTGFPSPFPPSDIPPGPSVFTVIEQQLGLKLVPDQGSRGYLVIDHVERPQEK
ncbi:MAG: TIGR03435 family protein [Acidobacteriia bacterium]|nr:TIGR03435 family protein [Terriglobia bacterium]